MDLLKKSANANDEGSVASNVSDEGYAEFLRFLQSPSQVQDNKKKGDVPAEKESNGESDEDSLPESLPDGPQVLLLRGSNDPSMEDSMALSANEGDESSGSFYVGPGEFGFAASGSIHESDISETESDDDEERSISTKDSSPVIDKNTGDLPAAKKNVLTHPIISDTEKDTSSVSNDEGYNEFLRFLMTPTVAISVEEMDRSLFLSLFKIKKLVLSPSQ
jgi:hypothetical protein